MSLGSITQANRNGHVYTDARSNDLIFNTKTLGQRILFGMSSNYPSTVSIGQSNIIYGSSASNVSIKHWGALDVDKNITVSNAFIRNQLGIGCNVVMVDPSLSLYVEGNTRVTGDLIVDGNIQAIDTNVTVTDEFLIVNQGTGAALQVVQNGVTPIASFTQSNQIKALITADGRVLIGSNVSAPVSAYDGMRVIIQGGMNVSNVLGVNATLSNINATDAYFSNVYMGGKLVLDGSGVITNSNFIPVLDTKKIQIGTFTSNFIENQNIISEKIASNITLSGRTLATERLGVATTVFENPNVRLKVQSGDVMIMGSNNYKFPGDQARLYFGSNSACFIGATCNVGITMQTANTMYPFVLEENSGFLGLGTMDPQERLHVQGKLKVSDRIHIVNGMSLGSGISSNSYDTLALSGNMTMSNFNTNVSLYAFSENLGINTYSPSARLHVRRHNSNINGDCFYLENPNNISFIVKANGNTGIGVLFPTEALDVYQNVKAGSNVYALARLAVGSSNPQYTLDASGDARFKNNVYIDDAGVLSLMYTGATANGTPFSKWNISCYTACNYLGIQRHGSNNNIIISDQGFMRIGDSASSRADERLHVSHGHAKFDCNCFMLSKMVVGGMSNATEAFEVSQGNAVFTSNIYVMNRIGVGLCNPMYALDVLGDINLSGVINQGAGNASFGSNVVVTNNLGIRTQTPTQALQVVNGNADFQSNAYIGFNLGIGTTAPKVSLDIRASDAMMIPVGTSLQRPSGPSAGYVRYNTTLSTFEGYGAGNAWGSLGGVKDTNQDTYISPESFPTSNDDTIRFFTSNAETMTMSMCNVTVRCANTVFNTPNGVPVRIGVNIASPETAVDINGDLRVANVLQTSNLRLGINTNDPRFVVHINSTDALCLPSGTLVQRPGVPQVGCVRYNTTYQTFEGFGAGNAWGSLGGVKDTNQDTYISAESFATSNDDIMRFFNSNQETMRITQAGFVGISNASPSERLDLSNGNARFGSNIYVMSRLGVATTSPQVSVQINASDSLGLPSGDTAQRPSNPQQGYIRYNTTFQTFEGYGAGNAWGSLGGVKDTNQDTFISAESFPSSNDDIIRFFNSNIETMKLMRNGFVGINTATPTERLELSDGNARFNSNVYVMQRLGVGLSNPLQSLHVAGNIRAANGTLGPMIMLIPPFAYTDVASGNRLILDNTLEAGNEAGSNVLFFGDGFISQDLSDDNMQWRQARILFRGTAQTNIDNEITNMTVQQWVSETGYTSLTSTFSVTSRQMKRGFLTYASPWFSMPSSDERHIAIMISSSTNNSTFRFGSVYLQFRA